MPLYIIRDKGHHNPDCESKVFRGEARGQTLTDLFIVFIFLPHRKSNIHIPTIKLKKSPHSKTPSFSLQGHTVGVVDTRIYSMYVSYSQLLLLLRIVLIRNIRVFHAFHKSFRFIQAFFKTLHISHSELYFFQNTVSRHTLTCSFLT